MRSPVPTAALVAAWPAASQVAAWQGRADLMPWITAGAIAALALLVAWRLRGIARIVAAAVAVSTPLAAAMLPASVVYAPPVAIDLALAAAFAATLRPGKEPMIARFARRERGGALEPDIAAYTRRLTKLWVALFVAMAIVATLLAIRGPFAAWSLFCNVVCYGLVTGALLGEYAYRRVRFRHYRHASLRSFLRAVAAGLPRTTPE